MVPPNLNFCSVSQKESLESQRKHALRKKFLRIILCSTENFNRGQNPKLLIRKGRSIFDKNFFQMKSCLIQYNAPPKNMSI